MSSKDVDFLVKLQDTAQRMADLASDQIEKLTPAIVKANPKDFNDLDWTEKEGSNNNPYEQTTKEANRNYIGFEALQQILEQHDGFWQNSSYKYWFHQSDKDTIDRRKK